MFSADQSTTNIPQKFNGEMLTFYLEKGTALVELAEDQNYSMTFWRELSNAFFQQDGTMQRREERGSWLLGRTGIPHFSKTFTKKSEDTVRQYRYV